ncbi:killer cell lectin-like receptor subfamily B member 1B allele C isoform X5 [Ciconia boyciana]|uniref:killer cell lectin-like receptor subfamily B member 1B allele C isoform X5 n=1 Tax=Ciconia boyciana TaxID=52775 RepID=UPI003B9E8DAA
MRCSDQGSSSPPAVGEPRKLQNWERECRRWQHQPAEHLLGAEERFLLVKAARGQGGFLVAEHGPDCLSEGEGCKLCPMGWTLHGTKCYWVVSDVNSWDQSKQDCVNRGAELLMPGDQEELRFLKEILQKPSRYFWIGLSIPSAGKGWTWLNGSRLDHSRFQLSPGDKGRSCGMLREDRISSDNCSSALQWICQKEATQL